jgi:hypothetical protein
MLGFLTEPFRQNQMIVGLLAFYSLLQSPLSAIKTYMNEYLQEYLIAYRNILGFSHPRMESEIRAFAGIIPLKEMFTEFIIGLQPNISPEKFLTMALQYIRLKLIAHVPISEQIIRQLAESLIQSPIKSNIFEENARLRAFFAIPSPLRTNLHKIGLNMVYVYMFEPINSKLKLNDMPNAFRNMCQSKCKYTTIYTSNPSKIHAVLESFESRHIIATYSITVNTNQQLRIYNINIPNFATSDSDFDSLNLGILDFVILNLFELTSVKDYLTQVDFFEHFVQLTENRWNIERKRLKEILSHVEREKEGLILLENFLGYRILPSAKNHIIENLDYITRSLPDITREEIIKRSNQLLNHNYLRYSLHQNFIELLVATPKTWKIALICPLTISRLINNSFLFWLQIGRAHV